MPYVEGFGTWPFGEEWLWEAIAGSYLPLLDLLDAGAPLTLSLTPVLCDQLEAPGWQERFATFVEEVRRHTHEEDAAGLRRAGHEELARELERSWRDYERALRRCVGAAATCSRRSRRTPSGPPRRRTRCCRCSRPTPACACRCRAASTPTARASARAGGAASGCPSARTTGAWSRCWPTPGVHSTCVELTTRFGLGAREHLRPLLGESGVVLVPIDRATMDPRVERRRLSGRRRLPRLPPPHDPPPHAVEQRRRRL